MRPRRRGPTGYQNCYNPFGLSVTKGCITAKDPYQAGIVSTLFGFVLSMQPFLYTDAAVVAHMIITA